MTSNVRWGLSCQVHNEALLGVILGYMTLLGATDIAWAPLRDPNRIKDPAAVARGKKGALSRARNARKRKRLLAKGGKSNVVTLRSSVA